MKHGPTHDDSFQKWQQIGLEHNGKIIILIFNADLYKNNFQKISHTD
jgi:hypothetical protein